MTRNFLLLVGSQAISGVGDALYTATLLIWVFALKPGSAAVSGVTLAQYLPALLIGPIAGMLVDRWNRRHTMLIATGGQALVALFPLLMSGAARLPAIYVSAFLIFLLAGFSSSAFSALLQVVVSNKQIAQAVAISQITLALASLAGAVLATPLYLAAGPTLALLIDAASFLLSALFIHYLRVPIMELHPYKTRASSDIKQGIRGWVYDIGVGFRFILETRILLVICMIALIALLGVGALQPLSVVFVSQRLHVNVALSGLLTAATGGGLFVGLAGAGMLAKWLAPTYLLLGGAFLLGLGIIAYSFQTVFLLALIMNVVIGIQQGSLQIGYLSTLISTTPREMIGRTQAVIQMCVAGMGLVSAGLAGYLGQFFSANGIIAVGGMAVALSGLVGWLVLRPTRSRSITGQEDDKS